MKEKDITRLRSFAIVGHSQSGKTSLVDTIFFNAGESDRWGKVSEGTSFADYFEEEKQRQTTIHSKVFCFNKDDFEIFVLDTPGFNDFYGETVGAMEGADFGVVVVDAVSGVQVQTTKVMRYLEEHSKPAIIYINRLDKEHANFDKQVDSIKQSFGNICVPVFIPVGKEASFKAVVSLLGETCQNSELKDDFEISREGLMEVIAESDDALTEKYLEGEKFSQDEIVAGIRKAILNRKLIPILCGSAGLNIGVKELVDFVCDYMPSPDLFPAIKSADGKSERKYAIKAPYSGRVFKIVSDPYIGQLTYIKVISGVMTCDHEVYNVSTRNKEKVNNFITFKGKEQKLIHEGFAGEIIAVAKLKNTHIGNTFADPNDPIEFANVEFPKPNTSFAVHAKKTGEDEKIAGGLHQIAAEDPTLEVHRNVETKELIVSGLGDLHINVKMDVLRKKYGVDMDLTVPKVAYRETVRKKSEGHCKHKKQSGGRGQYAEVFIRIEPMDRGNGFEFVDEIVGGVIPRNFIPGVEKGIVGALDSGVVAGFPVQDVRVRLYFGSFHTVDSSELAFKLAGSKAFKDAMEKADPYLLEPYMNVEIMVNDEFMGQVTGDLNSKRGRVMGLEAAGAGLQLIKAQAPLAEMYTFPTELRSITGGSAGFAMDFSHYEEVPAMIAKKVQELYKKKEVEEEE